MSGGQDLRTARYIGIKKNKKRKNKQKKKKTKTKNKMRLLDEII